MWKRLREGYFLSGGEDGRTESQLRASLRQLAVAEPPSALHARIWSQLPETAEPAGAIKRSKPAYSRQPKFRAAMAGVVVAILATSGAVTARIVLEPLQQQYTLMHEDEDLSRPFTATEGSFGVTARLDGLYGHDVSERLRWRVTGRVKLRVLNAQTGALLVGGQTSVMNEEQSSKLRSLLGPQSYAHLMGLNPVADPRTPPVLTVNENGRVTHLTGYGNVTVFDKWRFEIEPLPGVKRQGR